MVMLHGLAEKNRRVRVVLSFPLSPEYIECNIFNYNGYIYFRKVTRSVLHFAPSLFFDATP